MSTENRALTANKACTRCKVQKRRCDRAIPDCGLCRRLQQPCNYELPKILSSGPTPSPSPRPELFPSSGAFTSSHLKDAIIQKLVPLTPEDILLAYSRGICPWFPTMLIPRLQSRLPQTWDDGPLDVALLSLAILLVTTPPTASPEDHSDLSDFKSLYLHVKGIIALTESLGLNSFLIIHSRILVTLFEVAHGFYPAAYISIGAAVRAADAMELHPGADDSVLCPMDDEEKREETMMTWCGILILDRYITVDSGSQPSLTRARYQAIHDILKPAMCPAYPQEPDHSSPLWRLGNLISATSLLDKIHTTLNSPTPEHTFNMEEVVLTVQTSMNLQSIIKEEIWNEVMLYSTALAFVNISLLLAFENGSRIPLAPGGSVECNSIATPSLLSLFTTIVNMIEPFTQDTQLIDFNLLPPFMLLLVYKAAAIITERLFMDSDADESLRKLKILRKFLTIVGERWLGGERFIKLLNEDTTPRIRKALVQRL